MSFARRALQSLMLYRPDKTYNGFTLFAPATGEPSNTWLIDMQGQFVHRWKLPGWARNQVELLPNGNLLCAIRIPGGPFPDMRYIGAEVIEVDWDGNILWRYADPCMDTHGRVRMKNGNTLIQRYVPVPKDIAAKVKGGIAGTERNGVMYGSCLQEITPDNKVAWEYLSYEHLDPKLDAFSPLCDRGLWPVWNSLVELPDGNIMTCSPRTDNITIIDKSTGQIKWRWGKDVISFAHNPTMLDNGNILVFDNGRFSIIVSQAHSRVIEVNPSTGEIEWEYKAENPVDFYSSYIGGCQRLPNGNTLICEGAMGRLFEVTAKGEIVWEYIVPFYAYKEGYGLSNATFRAYRYGPDYPGLQGKKFGREKLGLWNRLYGPEAFGVMMRPSRVEMERTANTQEREPMEKKESEAKEEPRPSVARATGEATTRAKEEVRRRLDSLGY